MLLAVPGIGWASPSFENSPLDLQKCQRCVPSGLSRMWPARTRAVTLPHGRGSQDSASVTNRRAVTLSRSQLARQRRAARV